MSSYTERTLEYYRELGFEIGNVERYFYQNGVRSKTYDLFGVIDLIAIKAGMPVIGVQSTSDGEHTEHRKKILAEPLAKLWLQTGARLHLISWKKRKVSVMGKWWTEKLEEFGVEDFA